MGARATAAAARPAGYQALNPVSKHLKVLQNSGLVEHSSRGTRNLYSLAPDGLRELQQYLIGLWDVTLQSFAEYVATSESTSGSPSESPVESTAEPRSEG